MFAATLSGVTLRSLIGFALAALLLFPATGVSTPIGPGLSSIPTEVPCGSVPLAQPADAATVCYSFDSPGGPFNGLLRSGAAGNDVGIVFLHGRGNTPNSKVVRQLRGSLANAGYTTLSIDNPVPLDTTQPGGGGPNGVATDFNDYVADVLGPNTVFPEAFARVRESIAFLAGKAINRIIVAGFSLGSRLATAHVARGQQPGDLPIIGLIGLGMRANSVDPLNAATTLDEVFVPVLDIFGDGDVPAAVTAFDRLNAYGGAPADYTQVILDCAASLSVQECHQFNGLKGADDQPLETAVRLWVNDVASVPEPNALAFLAIGILGLTYVRRRLAG